MVAFLAADQTSGSFAGARRGRKHGKAWPVRPFWRTVAPMDLPETMEDVDLTLRHVSRRFPEQFARALLTAWQRHHGRPLARHPDHGASAKARSSARGDR